MSKRRGGASLVPVKQPGIKLGRSGSFPNIYRSGSILAFWDEERIRAPTGRLARSASERSSALTSERWRSALSTKPDPRSLK